MTGNPDNGKTTDDQRALVVRSTSEIMHGDDTQTRLVIAQQFAKSGFFADAREAAQAFVKREREGGSAVYNQAGTDTVPYRDISAEWGNVSTADEADDFDRALPMRASPPEPARKGG